MRPEPAVPPESDAKGSAASRSDRSIRFGRVTSTRAFLTVCLAGALFLVTTQILALDPSIANTQYSLTSWSSDDGLPQNFVGAIAQTPDGYLWFATEEGLARFDGARFTRFLDRRSIGALLVSHDGSLWIAVVGGLVQYKDHKMTTYAAPSGLRGLEIHSLSEGPDGSIWMATRSGLNRYYQGKFSAYVVADGSATSWIWVTYTTRDGALWCGTNGGGLRRLYQGAVTTYTTSDGLADNIVHVIRQDRNGDLWIGTNGGLSKMHDGKITTFSKVDGLTNSSVGALEEDRDGNLWIGTDGGGLNRYSGGKFTSFGLQHKLSNTTVSSLMEDREGSLWVGTSGAGLSQLRPGKFITVGRSEGLNADVVWSVREATDGSLLIGTNHGFARWEDGVMTSLTVRDGLSSEIVRSVMEDHTGGIWLGTKAGANLFKHGKVTVYRTVDGLPDNNVWTTAEDRQGNIWIGTRGGGLARYRDGVFKVFNRASGLANDTASSVTEDHDGGLWIGTNGGVSVLKNGVFVNYTMRDGLSSDSVRGIYHDRNGGHWIGTYGGGLNRIKNGHIATISVKDGLFNEVVFSIVEDRSGNLWMTCNRGVFRVSLKELNDFADGRIKRVHSTSFDAGDGMKAAECNGGSPGAWEGRDGRLFFATVRGVAIVDPNHMAFNSLAPPVWNEEVVLDGTAQTVSPTGLTVGPGRHSLEIHYTALSLISPKDVEFRYRLRGFSDDWVIAGNRRTAFYTNLPPGRYTFEVMGSNNDGIWSRAGNPLQIQFQAAFFQTAWFKVLCGVVFLLAAWAAYRLRLNFLEERERLLVTRVDEQTAELIAGKEELRLARDSAENNAAINGRLAQESSLILNSATDGIMVLSIEGRPTFLNPAGTKMLGMTLSDMAGKTIHEAIHHSHPDGRPWPEADCAQTQSMRDDQSQGIVNDSFWRKDGTSFPVEYAFTKIVDKDGSKRGAVIIFRDVTERRAVERLKSEFVSTVSHELRTPLTSIRGALGLLGSGLLGPIAQKGQRMLEIAIANTDRLVRLINDMLDLERIGSGKVELESGLVDAYASMVQAAESVLSMADEAGVNLVIERASGELWGDSDRIIQTLTNLIGNAIKFSPSGTTVSVTGSSREADFVFCVTDQGRGVPDDKRESIFERFTQVDASDSRDKGGSGLGLAICQSIVTAHGGRIWVESNHPAGSRFQFTIPLAVSYPVAPAPIDLEAETIKEMEGQHAA